MNKKYLSLWMAGLLLFGVQGISYASDSPSSSEYIVYPGKSVDAQSASVTADTKDDERGLSVEEMEMKRILDLIERQRVINAGRKLIKEDMRENVVDEYMDQTVPLRPDEILELRRMARDAQRATQRPLGSPPKSVIKTMELDVNNPEPVPVFVSSGYVSSLVYFDQTGAPWPVESVVVGDKDSFKATIIGEENNIISLNVMRQFATGNMLVNLKSLPMPLTVSLTGDDKTVHARLNMMIPRFGPNAKTQITSESDIDNAPPDLLNILDGQAPGGAVRRRLEGISGDVWEFQGELYIRTSATLISPAWKNHAQSGTGIHAYKLSPVTELRFAKDGSVIRARIGEVFEYSINK